MLTGKISIFFISARILALSAWILVNLMYPEPSLSSTSETDKKITKNILKALEALNWEHANRLSKKFKDPSIKIFIDWVKLREGAGSFEEYLYFLKHYRHWPGLKFLRQKGEAKIDKNIDFVEVVNYFKDNDPSTGFGSIKLIQAYKGLGLEEKALKEVKRAWLSLPLERREFNFLIKEYNHLVVGLASERLDVLLWNGMTAQAKRLFNYINNDIRALAKARIALQNQNYGVDALIRNVPVDLKEDPGLAYDRFIWRIKRGRIDSATDILEQYSRSKNALKYPSKWSRKRRDYARQAMRDNKNKLAYFLASNHFISNGPDYADLEWLAGYISLIKLKNPPKAIVHFNNFLNEVRTPISLGRAGYWLGRAYEANNNLNLSNYYYRLGSNYQSSFYGQLSSEKLGRSLKNSYFVPSNEKTIGRPDFEKSDVFRLALIFQNANELDLSRRFFSHFAENLNKSEHYELTSHLSNLNNNYLALILSKQAARKGRLYHDTYFPLHDLVTISLEVAPEILLSVARRESEFNSEAISSAGARGLMQLMPGTAKKMAHNLKLKYSLKRLNSDWRYNVELGAEYLHFLLSKYDGSLLLALGAYNAGPSRMDGWIKKYGDPRLEVIDYIDWVEHIPFNETRNYIMRVLEAITIYHFKLNDEDTQRLSIILSAND